MEVELELYTVKQFYNTMFNGVDNAYGTKWLKVKLIQKYDDVIQIVMRQGQSYIIFLSTTSSFSNEKWCKPRETY